MNISSNINQIADTNAINRIYGYGGYKKSTAPIQNEVVQDVQKQDDIKLTSNSILSKVDVEDIKKTASQIGEEITEDDIKYGLTYGRSVLADFIA